MDAATNNELSDLQMVQPAFPMLHGGMTLREFFAAHAMVPLLREALKNDRFFGLGPDYLSDMAYEVADEMLKAGIRTRAQRRRRDEMTSSKQKGATE